jgi:hypothetical protein
VNRDIKNIIARSTPDKGTLTFVIPVDRLLRIERAVEQRGNNQSYNATNKTVKLSALLSPLRPLSIF